jgi:hypothetical protein
MKIDNRTPYATRVLRSIMIAVANEVAASHGPTPREPVVKIVARNPKVIRCTGTDGVTHEARRSRTYSGHAYLSGRRAVLSIPTTGLDVVHFSYLWRHELFHLYGIRHPDYPRGVRYFDTEITPQIEARIVARFGSRVEPEAAPGPEPAEDRIGAKLTVLDARERRWRMIAKRAATYLAKIKRSRTYYQGQLAKAANARP